MVNTDGLRENLQEIDNVIVSVNEGTLVIKTALPGYQARIKIVDVVDYMNIISPYMQDCTRINLKDGGFVIVTPDDFVFDVPEMVHVKIKGMPPMCPVTDILNDLEDVRKHLEEIQCVDYSPNIDGTVATYLMYKHLMQCALKRGINVDGLLREFEETAEKNGVKEVGALLERFEREEG